MFGKEQKQILAAMGYTITSNLKDLGDFEFPAVVQERAQAELGCSDVEFEAVKLNLLNYFAVVKDEKSVEMIDEKADVLWHTLLLDTKAYMELCSEYIGFYVHHNPYTKKKEVSSNAKSVLQDCYVASRKRHPNLNKKYDSYVDRYRNDDDTMNWLLFYAIVSCSSCSAEAAESTCGGEVMTDSIAIPEKDSEPETSVSRCGSLGESSISSCTSSDTDDSTTSKSTCSSAPASSCSSSSDSGSSSYKSSCSSSSSSSCSSSSSSSCGSSCGS